MFFPFRPLYTGCTVDFLSLKKAGKGGSHLGRRYLTAVALLPDHILQVDFVSGARLPLADPKVWHSAVTNGIFVRFGNVEISHDELLAMAEREH